MARTKATTTRTVASRRGATFKVPYAISFANATNNTVTLDTATMLDTTQAFAFAFWMDASENWLSHSATAQGVFALTTDQGIPFQFRFVAASTATAYVSIGPSSTMVVPYMSNTTTINKIRRGWHHYCVVFDGVSRTASSSYTIYIDGTSVAWTGTTTHSVITNVSVLGLLGGSFPCAKRLAEFRIWNGGSVMTAAQVADLYASDTIPSGPTLKREYLFTEGSGTSVAETANGFTATLANATWTTNVPRMTRTAASVRTVA